MTRDQQEQHSKAATVSPASCSTRRSVAWDLGRCRVLTGTRWWPKQRGWWTGRISEPSRMWTLAELGRKVNQDDVTVSLGNQVSCYMCSFIPRARFWLALFLFFKKTNQRRTNTLLKSGVYPWLREGYHDGEWGWEWGWESRQWWKLLKWTGWSWWKAMLSTFCFFVFVLFSKNKMYSFFWGGRWGHVTAQ